MHSTNIIFNRTFFPVASYKISKNYVILINHGLFFQEKGSLQLHRLQFFEINFLMAETI